QWLPNNARYGAVGFNVNSYGIIATGGNGNYYFTDCYAYYPPINQWINLPVFTGTIRRHACSFSINGKGYLSCGISATGSTLNDLWELSEVTAMPEAAVVQPKVYFNKSNKTLTVTGLPNKRLTLKIFSLSGQLVFNQVFQSDNLQIPLHLNSGIYSYSIEGVGKILSGKFELL
ncbi:MAG TPA: T9SS type A sorting domain-containing protein, partial [Bacteroidia bacterium]|nr:T9SS type A sorting domain-containing protein [Bacteroidia bacterium]